jgi:hypothetical protein
MYIRLALPVNVELDYWLLLGVNVVHLLYLCIRSGDKKLGIIG